MALFRAPMSSTVFRDFRRPLLVCSVSSTTPRKPFNRKNYLREKLLRTVTLPHPDSLVSNSPHKKNPIVEIESPNRNFGSGGGVKLEEVEFQGTEESAVEESVGISDEYAGNIPEVSFFRVGLWLVGAFVFQTVFAVVWMLGSVDLDDKNDKTLSDEDENGRLEIELNEKDVPKDAEYPDDVRLQDKIEEIRMMAREVRESEKTERKKNSVENEDNEEEEDDFGKSGIEKEVRDRLLKLHKRLENGRGKLSIAVDDNVKKEVYRKHEVGTNGLSTEDGLVDKSNSLLNLNKHVNPEDVIKDSDSENHTDDEGISDSGVDSTNQTQKLDLQGADSIILTMRLEDDCEQERAKTSGTKFKKRRGGGTLGKKAGFGKSEPKSLKQDMVKRRHENEASKSGKSSTTFGMSTISNINNALLGYDYFKTDQSHSEAELNKAGNRTGLWWLSLPYVLVIYMRRDGEGLRGLFHLKNGSDANGTVSYTIAFEGREDAYNFCYILETTFGDHEDFSAEVVPITIKELGGVVKSDYNRVIVVKKGQLKLYAGQPLQDVEMALRSLVEQT